MMRIEFMQASEISLALLLHKIIQSVESLKSNFGGMVLRKGY